MSQSRAGLFRTSDGPPAALPLPSAVDAPGNWAACAQAHTSSLSSGARQARAAPIPLQPLHTAVLGYTARARVYPMTMTNTSCAEAGRTLSLMSPALSCRFWPTCTRAPEGQEIGCRAHSQPRLHLNKGMRPGTTMSSLA